MIQTFLNYLDLVILFGAVVFIGWLFSFKIASAILKISLAVCFLILLGALIGIGFNLVTKTP